MCGLVAVINKNPNGFYHRHCEAFEQLLLIDTLRGEDSTGVYVINNIGNVGIAKDVGTGGEFITKVEWKSLRERMIKDGWAMVGHNRKATRGSVTDVNAHPFWVDDKLVLVHNGSYNGSHKELADTEVDSEAIAIHLAKNSDDIEGALQKVNAAYALIWYDIDNKQINIACNGQRPLHWAETSDAYYITSEKEILEFVLNRQNIKAEINSFPINGLNVFKLNEDKRTTPEFIEMDIKYKSPFRSTTNYSHSHYSQQKWWEEKWGLGDSYVNKACGWDTGSCEYPIHHRATSVDEKLVEEVNQRKASNEISEVSSKLKVYPNMNTFMFNAWSELKRKEYSDNTKIKVIVDDYVQHDTKSKDVIVTGQTLDSHRVPVWFKLDIDMIDKLTAGDIDSIIFEVEVNGGSWRRVDPTNVPFEQANGVAWIAAKSPKLTFINNVGMQ